TRSVAMPVVGDDDCTTPRQLPAGRSVVRTHLVPAGQARWMQRVWALVAEEVAAGGRVYVVAPRISASQEEDDGAADLAHMPADGQGVQQGQAVQQGQGAPGGEQLDLDGARRSDAGLAEPPATVEATIERLRRLPVLQGIEIALMHGRLGAEEKEAAMAGFASGRTPVLVTTTVIEVGVDVPEATVMVVLDADRFGLSQLHQLRGRIGRGSAPGTCLLVTSARPDSPATVRLQAMVQTTDGFVLAERDLEQRREGDVLGAAQSGRTTSLRLLSVV